MPNQRRAGQTFIGTQIDVDLAAQMDRARGRKDRSQWVREAIAEKLERMGISVPEDLIYAPARAKVIQMHSGIGNNYSLNESPPKYRAKKKSTKK